MAGSPTLFAGTFTVPGPGAVRQYKVRLNGAWDRELRRRGTFGLRRQHPPARSTRATARFTYDHATHRVTVAPGDAAGGADRAPTARMAGDSLRKDLTRENFYFVMADRFENGDAGQRHGRHHRRTG